MEDREYRDLENRDQALWTYRLAQLEIKVETGFRDLITELRKGYATKEELKSAVTSCELEQKRIEGRVNSNSSKINEINEWLKWATRIVIGAVIGGILTVVGIVGVK